MWSADLTECKGQGPGSVSWNESVSLKANAHVFFISAAGTIECNTVLDEADRHLQSWSYWDTASGGVFWSGDEVNLEAVK